MNNKQTQPGDKENQAGEQNFGNTENRSQQQGQGGPQNRQGFAGNVGSQQTGQGFAGGQGGQQNRQDLGRSRGRSMQKRQFDDRGYSSPGTGYAGLWAALIGMGAGVAAMYLLDPDRGRRRRGLIGDKITRAGRGLPEAARATGRDLSNRARGMWAEATNLFSSDNPGDQVIEARVRSKMGHVTNHPHGIHVTSREGHVTLEGVVLASELPSVLQTVQGVKGVNSVENRLQTHDSPQNIPSLQGGGNRQSGMEGQQNWSPAARVGAGALGLGISAVGATILARTVTSSRGGRSAITIDKAIKVNAPPDVLYALWSNFENFPQFMSNVLEVRNIDDRRSHWKVAGPAGIPVEWDAEITKVVPNELIAWRSVEGSTVANAGYVLFEPNDDGTTEVIVRMSYNPPAGAIGHAVAKVFGADPKSEMDQDLMRMKSLLETGKLPHDAAQDPYSGRSGRVH